MMRLVRMRKSFPLLVILGVGLLAFAAIHWAAQPSADVAVQTITVGNDAELKQAIARAQSGTIIKLKPGIYSSFAITNKEQVTIEAEKLREYEASRQPYEVGNLALLPHIQGTEKTKDVILARGKNLAFRGLHISVAQRNGILTVNSDIVLVESSVIHDVARTNGQGILFDSTSNATAQNNVIYDIQGSRAHAIYAAGSASDNPKFIGNIGYDIDGAVYQLNAEDNKGDKTISGAVIKDNIAQDGPFGGNFCGVTNSQFVNNLGFRLDKGLTFYAGNGLCAEPQNNKFYYNTIVTRSGDPLMLQDGKNYDIRNNILLGGLAKSSVKDIDSATNLVGQSADPFTTTDGRKYLDYRLKAATAAVDKGEIVAGVTADFLGGQRVVGVRPDFGAFEYGSSSLALPSPSASPSPAATEGPVVSLPTTRRVSQNGLTIIAESDKVALAWRAYTKSDLVNYVVSRRDEGSNVFRRLATLDPKTLTFTDTAVQAGKAYQYKIRIVTRKRSVTGKVTESVRDWIEAVTITLPRVK